MHRFAYILTLSATLTIFSHNIIINDVSIGNMTYDAALELLASEISLADEQIIITCAGMEHIYNFKDFGADYDFITALDEAMNHSQSNGFFDQLKKSLFSKFSSYHIDADFIYDNDKITQIASKLRNEIALPAAEPSYAIENDCFVFSEGAAGRDISVDELTGSIASILNTLEGGTISLTEMRIHPKYTVSDFEAACDLIGSYQTPYNPLLPERTTNLFVANTFLDGQVILPNETFSTSDALRPRTIENGYVKAGQIVNGEPDAGIGGGICQISSTLYMAALYAEIPVPKRNNHSLMVGYMAPATDAALAEGYIDLVLENNTNHPILIQSILEHGRHIVNIYGHESRTIDRIITFESILLETTPPEGDKIIEDPFLPLGTSQIVSQGLNGAKYELYKIIAENGQTERILVNASTYRPLQRVVRVGISDLTNDGECGIIE
ncbi:MAG: VanW family protein [Defluviitaleaceae bacterium]|nr:VanW family protein [Defluviitaleaceae bacterium]